MAAQHTTQSTARRTGVVTHIVVAAGCAALAAVLVRVAWLQIDPDPRLVRLGARGGASWVHESPRGDLLDRRGRTLAASAFEYQPVVDPTLAPDPPDAWILRVAEALDRAPEDVGRPIVEALADNDAARAARGLATAPAASASIGAGGDAVWLVGMRRIAGAIGQRLRGGQEAAAAAPAIAGEAATVAAATAGAAPAAGGAPSPAANPAPKLKRYLPLGGAIDQGEARRIAALRVPGLWLERRPTRVTQAGEDLHGLAPLVGKVGKDENGRIGAEKVFHRQLSGGASRLALVRDARGRPLWMERGDSDFATRGEDIRLAVDLVIQRMALEELTRGVEDADAAGGRLVAIDPRTGELLAMVDLVREIPGAVPFPFPDAATPATPGERDRLWGGGPRPRFITITGNSRPSEPALRRQRCLTDAYEPGSTFKALVWAAVYDMGVMREGEVIHTEPRGHRLPYGRVISDVTKLSEHTWDQVLVRSSNIGMALLCERVGFKQLRDVVRRYGFGEATGLGLPNESPGLVTAPRAWRNYTQTSVAMGHEIAVTPLQMARAFTALARTGDDAGTIPGLRLRAMEPSGEGMEGDLTVAERVISREAAEHTRAVLSGVVDNVDAKMKRRFPDEPAPRYPIFGKSGTAEIPLVAPAGKRRPRGLGYYEQQYNASFIAAGPSDAPVVVMICVIDDPGPLRVRQEQYFGSDVAGPVVRRLMERVLPYMGVMPPAPPADAEAAATASVTPE